MSPLKIGIPLNFHLLLHLFFNHLNLKRSWFLKSWFNNDLGSPCTVSNSLSYNTITNQSIQCSSLISLLHSLYSHRSDNSIVSATQNLCRHQRQIKIHKIYVRGIIILYVSSTVILFHLQRAGFVNILCGRTHTSSDTSCISQTLFHLGRTRHQSSSTLQRFHISIPQQALALCISNNHLGFPIHTI